MTANLIPLIYYLNQFYCNQLDGGDGPSHVFPETQSFSIW